MNKLSLLFAITWFVSILGVKAGNWFSISKIKCEQEENPMGLDIPQPRFSWQIASPERGFEQFAYQLIVADSPETITRAVGNLWDSRRVKSRESLSTIYGGKALQPGKRYYWRVKIWNVAGKASF